MYKREKRQTAPRAIAEVYVTTTTSRVALFRVAPPFDAVFGRAVRGVRVPLSNLQRMVVHEFDSRALFLSVKL